VLISSYKKKTAYTGGRCREQGLYALQKEVNNNLAVIVDVEAGQAIVCACFYMT